MHFEILSEDQSGKKALDIIIPKLLNAEKDTFRIISYKGIGRIQKNLATVADPVKRILLDNLPKLLQGYGQSFIEFPAVVIIVCDLDDRDFDEFSNELNKVLESCEPRPETRFCIATEEGEAWFLGDILAIKSAYPRAKDAVLRNYKNDSICGTWEKLADAVYPGGAIALRQQGWQKIGAEKYQWAERIPPKMDLLNNKSPSFCAFCECISALSETN